MLQNRSLRSSRTSWRQFWLIILVVVLILFGTHHSSFALAAFALCCFTMLLADYSFVISFLFFIMPMAGIFKLAPEETSLFTYLELLFVVLHVIKKKFRTTYGELIALFFGVYIVITASLYSSLNITRAIKMVMNLVLIGYFAELIPEREYKRLFLYYIFGMIISSLMRFADSSYFPIEEYVAVQTERYAGMATTRFAGLYADPNYYSINVIIAMCLLIVLYRRRELSFPVVVGLMVPLVFFVGLTGSKSSFLMLILPIILLMYVCIKNRNYVALLGCIFGILLIVIFVAQGTIQIFDYVLNRLKNTTSGLAVFTTGRTAIWQNYFRFFGDNLIRTIFGTGAAIDVLDGVGAHNTYIDFIFLLGIVGTGLYIWALYYNIRKVNRSMHRNFLNYSVFLTLCVMYAFLSELLYFDLPFHIALAGMVWNLNTKGDCQR